MKNNNNYINHNRRPSISFYNKYLINSIDMSMDNDININNSFVLTSNNPLSSIKTFNKPKKELVLAKLDTNNLHKRKKKKKEEINIINKTVNYEDSESFLMAAKLSSSFMTDKNHYNNSNIYYPKKNIRTKSEFYNNTITKEKTSYISDNDIFDSSPLEKFNRQMDSVSKIQSCWRGYNLRKRVKIINFIKILSKYLYKSAFNKILLFKNKKEKIYHKKFPEKNKNIFNYELIKTNNSFNNYDLQIEEKINEITILDNKNQKNILEKKFSEEKKYYKFNKSSWIKLPFSIEKYIKKKIAKVYYNSFFDKFKNINKEKLKERQKIVLNKLINSNNIRNIRKYMKKYKEAIIIEKTKQNIYNSLIKKKPKIKKNKSTSFFNFQYFYKQNILRDIIKKYRYTSVVQKYYFLWKKKMDRKNKIVENKKKKYIKIKRVKKNEEHNKHDLNFGKEDTISNVSEIGNNNNLYNSYVSNSIQSIKNLKGSLTVTNKKMRIKKITVDHNYYEYIENNNNYYSNYK